MAEDPVPIEGVAVKSGDFRAVTKATGDALRRKLEEDTDSAIKNKGFDSYEIKPYEKDLENVMKLFRETVRGTSPARRKTFTLTSSTRNVKPCIMAEISSGAPYASLLVLSHSTRKNAARRQRIIGCCR